MSQPPRDEDFVPRRPLTASPLEDTQPHVGLGIDPELHQPSRYFDMSADAIEDEPPTITHHAPAVTGPDSADQGEPSVKAKGKKKEGVKVRRARLRLVHVSPWSVMKLAFLLSVALGIVTVVAVAIVWDMLGRTGLWDSINSTVGQVVNSGTGPSFDIRNYVGTNRVLGLTMVVAVVDIVLVTIMATLGAFLYNMAADLLGGIEVTLAEEH